MIQTLFWIFVDLIPFFVYFFFGFWIALLLPSFHLFDFTQLFMYGILTLASVISLVAKKPFTLQYAKKVVPIEFTAHRLFFVSNFWFNLMERQVSSCGKQSNNTGLF